MNGLPFFAKVNVNHNQESTPTVPSSMRGAGTISWNHTLHVLSVLSINEVRLRLRRLSSLVALMAMIVLSWSMIVDPKTGSALLAIQQTRVLYTSSALAMGSASLLSFLFALIGFYLVRGRIVEDLRSGIGCVIGATPVGNSLFLFSRWLGGVAYIFTLIVAAMSSIMVLHALRGDGGIEFLVYLQTYLLVLGPMAIFAVSAAILFDSVPLLMGKAGDVIYFLAWILQVSLISTMDHLSAGALSPWLLLDFSGLVSTIVVFKTHLLTSHFSIGASTFNPLNTPITLPVNMWSTGMILIRAATAGLALSLLLPAISLFHRFSPDKVKQSHASKRRSPLEILNTWTRPLAKQVQPLFAWSARSANFFGQVLADIALTFVHSPFAILVLASVMALSALVNLRTLPDLSIFAVAFWGVLISDMSTRDFQAAIESMTATVQGGASRRYVRQLSATIILGFLFTGVIALRMSFSMPFYALVLLLGIVSMSVLANSLGRLTNSSKTFMSLYLFAIYVSTQVDKAPLIDMFGYNQVATISTIAMQLEVAFAAGLVAYFYTRWKSR